MWPQSIALRIDDTIVTVGTDDDVLLRRLERWAVDDERELVDFVVEVSPQQPSERGAPRKLANLRHGSSYLLRSNDTELLRTSLLRMLGAYEHAPSAGQVRVSGMVLERSGHAYVFPLRNVQACAVRQLQQWGFVPHYAQSVLIDAGTSEVVLDPQLGDDELPRCLPLGGLWLGHRYPGEATTRAVDVARLLGNLDLVGVTAPQDAQAVLDAVVRIAESDLVRYVGADRSALENELTALIGR